jgi:hypothetical protein
MGICAAGLALIGGCGSGKVAQTGPDYGPETADMAVKDDSATSPSTITALTLGTVVRTTFTSTRHWRAFKFNGLAGQKVDIYLDGLSGLDTVVYLYRLSRITGKPISTSIASNDDTDVSGWVVRSNSSPNPYSSAILSFSLPEDRPYAVLATTYQQAYQGAAELFVRQTPGEPVGALNAFTLQFVGKYAAASGSAGSLSSVQIRRDGSYTAVFASGTIERGTIDVDPTNKQLPLTFTFSGNGHPWTGSVQNYSDQSMHVGSQALQATTLVGPSETLCDQSGGAWTDDETDPTTGLFCVCGSGTFYIPSLGGCVP